MSLGRITAQGLIPTTVERSLLDAVENLATLQGQQASVIPWAIGVRCAGVSHTRVEELFMCGEPVRSQPMRGTVHVASARDHHWLRRLLRHRRASWERQAFSLGLTDALIGRAAQVARDLLETSPLGVSRAELVEMWSSSGIGIVTASSSQDGLRRRHLTICLHVGDVLTAGPVRAGEHLIVDACSLPAAPGVAKGEPGHEEALAALAARYARGHGPVDEAGLARWTGLTLTGARRALVGACVAGGSMGLPLAAFGTGLAHADLTDPVEDFHAEAKVMLALPSSDELHVGYKDRSCLTDEAGEASICSVKNGMLRPIAAAGGRVVAVRAPDGQVVAVDGCGAYEESARWVLGDWEKWLFETQQ